MTVFDLGPGSFSNQSDLALIQSERTLAGPIKRNVKRKHYDPRKRAEFFSAFSPCVSPHEPDFNRRAAPAGAAGSSSWQGFIRSRFDSLKRRKQPGLAKAIHGPI